MMRQLGYESAISGGALWIDGVFAILFVLVGGWLGDHFPIRRTMFVFGLLEACAVGVLAFAETLPMFYLSAAIAGMGTGGMLPLTLAARGVYFGRRNFATITGLSLMLPNLVSGGALAGILIAWLSEIIGAYTLPLAIIAVIGAVGSLAFLFLGDPKLAPSQNSRLEMPVHLPEG